MDNVKIELPGDVKKKHTFLICEPASVLFYKYMIIYAIYMTYIKVLCEKYGLRISMQHQALDHNGILD